MVTETSHEALADQLRRRVLDTGTVGRDLREGSLQRGGGDSTPIAEPYDALVKQIGEASYRVTDQQFASVRAVVGSDKAAFEVVMSASIGAGLCRWDAAVRAIQEATDATA
jgi:hypothetical protein